MSAACPACPRAATCRADGSASCTGAGARSSLSTIPFQRCCANGPASTRHLVTDHFHYFEDGGATYHTRYDSYEFIRGQEGDPWKAMVQPPWERLREMYHERQFSHRTRDKFRRNIVNREFIRDESEFPSVQCFAAGFDFLDRNRTPTIGCCRSRRSIRTSRSRRRSDSARTSRQVGTGRSATGRAMVVSTNCRRSVRSFAPTTTQS